ncbi:NADP-dependent phosphogluconate dehydrogenase [Suttonella ornithocola]|uniref:6-phosphogluconate dehydrogenase, decarboxylating n=1 Tax=Suttonella ornithocola TaxID=279832 RepID=A0A380MVE6_9GAMM|nr:NADP-dependent phosphogluconate dehydrogenase [Suttonella ornithocola]SUO95893.1 6-phosphogluconate dehydrogenase, decarboxylating 2 [Suttonella ornithocola]
MNDSVFHLVVMGVSGCGKTTLAENLSAALGLPYAEADDFHPQANIEKMQSGIPLNDDDRYPWLIALRDWMDAQAKQGKSSIISCSALKKSYRELLSQATGNIYFLHITGPEALHRERMLTRKGHFMPPALLRSQLDTLEPLENEENGIKIDLALTPSEQLDKGLEAAYGLSSHLQSQYIGLVGCGVMGAALAHNLVDKGNHVTVFDIDSNKAESTARYHPEHNNSGSIFVADSWQNLVDKLTPPRTILLVVPAGKATDAAIEALSPYLNKDDIIVDLGNAYYKDTQRREFALREKGIHFAGCGMSGGENGARHGPSLMFGGSEHAYRKAASYLRTIAARADDGRPCFAYVGTDGAGHYVKMVHNGIEYADMQLIAEAYSLMLRALNCPPIELAQYFQKWNQGVLSSYLMDITADILAHRDYTGKALVENIDDRAGQKGTGAWTTQNALEIGVSVNMIAEATFARNISMAEEMRQAAQMHFKQQSENLPSYPEGYTLVEDLEQALMGAKIIAYSQGFSQIQSAEKEYGWQINLAQLAAIWRKGCIIRAEFLTEVITAYRQQPDLPLLAADGHFSALLQRSLPAWRRVNCWAMQAGIPIPVLSAGLAFIDSLQTKTLPTTLIQAQRDYFGAHTYRRTDNEGSFHTQWQKKDKKEIKIN